MAVFKWHPRILKNAISDLKTIKLAELTGAPRINCLTGPVDQSMIGCMSLTSIKEEIVYLSSAERAKLIDILWDSLDEERIKEIETKWAVESEERIDAVDRGELETIDGPSALRDLRSSLK